MGTYTKSVIGRAPRPRSERLRQLGGVVSSSSAASAIAGSSVAAAVDLTDIIARIAKLESQQFFEVYGDDTQGYSVKAKDGYVGVWTPGWLAAGGAESDSGTGGVLNLRQLEDVYHGSAGVLRSDGTAAQNGDSLVYDYVNARWCAGQPSGTGGSSVAWGTPGTDSIPLTVDGSTKTLLTSHQSLYGYATQAWVQQQGYISEHQSLADYALKTGDSSYNFLVNTLRLSSATLGVATVSSLPRPFWRYVDNVSSVTPSTVTKYLAYKDEIPTSLKSPYALTFGNKTYDGSAARTITAADLGALTAHQDLSNYVTLNGVQTITGQKTFSARVTMSGADLLPSSDDANGVGSTSLRFNQGHFRNINTSYFQFIDGTSKEARGNIGIGQGYAQVTIKDGTEQNCNYMFYADSASGFFKSGGGFPLGKADHRWSYVYSVNADLTGDLLIGGDIVPAADLGSALGYSGRRFSDLNVANVSLNNINLKNERTGVKTGYISGKSGFLMFQTGANIGTSYKQLIFHETYGFYPEGTGINLGYNGTNYRWECIYGKDVNLSGHIDIGPVRIEYDSDSRALHITCNDNGNPVGLYADGFVAAGGVS